MKTREEPRRILDTAPATEGGRELDVCLATLKFHPVYAGPSVRFRRYAPGLARRGARLRVFSGAFDEPGYSPGELLPPEEVEGIQVRRVSLPRMGRDRIWLWYMTALARHCASPRQRPSVLHLLDLWTWSTPWLLRLRAAGIPILYTHTMVQAGGAGRFKAMVAGLPYRLVDRVVVSSSVMGQELQQSGVRTPIDVIGNGVDVTRFRPVDGPDERRRLRLRLALPPDGEIIAFIGGFLSERKGVDVLARAWKEIARRPRAHLVLVGPHLNEIKPAESQRAFLAQVNQALEDSGARDRVHVTGAVDAVEDFLRAADLFVFPSRREGMPNVVLEAFACGVASILTPFEGLPEEFGRPGEQYALVDRTPHDLADAVISLLEDSGRRSSLAAAGRRWAENEMDVEHSLDRYVRLYDQLAGSRRGSRERDS